MKTLLILRHAKSSWKEQDLPDHDRPLNKRGKNDAPRMGKLLKDEDLIPDLIMSSTAVRAKKTAELVAKACKYKGKIVLNHSLGPTFIKERTTFALQLFLRTLLVEEVS